MVGLLVARLQYLVSETVRSLLPVKTGSKEAGTFALLVFVFVGGSWMRQWFDPSNQGKTPGSWRNDPTFRSPKAPLHYHDRTNNVFSAASQAKREWRRLIAFGP